MISLATIPEIMRQGLSQALPVMNGTIDTSLREMARAHRIRIEKIEGERGILSGWSVPFQTNAYILVSENHDMQVWYERDCDCGSCDEYAHCVKFIGDFASGIGISLEMAATPTKMAEELLATIQEGAK